LLFHPSCPVLTVLSLLSYSCRSALFPILAVRSRLSFRLSCPSSPVPAFMSWLSCPGCLVPAVLSKLSYISCPVPAVCSPVPVVQGSSCSAQTPCPQLC
jgi:hypothetical protein